MKPHLRIYKSTKYSVDQDLFFTVILDSEGVFYLTKGKEIFTYGETIKELEEKLDDKLIFVEAYDL